MNVRQLDRASDIITKQEQKIGREGASVHAALKKLDQAKRHDKKSFQEIRQMLLERGTLHLKEQQLLGQLLTKKKTAITKAKKQKGELEQKLLDVLKKQEMLKKQKDKIGELQVAAKVKRDLPIQEQRSEEMLTLRSIQSSEGGELAESFADVKEVEPYIGEVEKNQPQELTQSVTEVRADGSLIEYGEHREHGAHGYHSAGEDHHQEMASSEGSALPESQESFQTAHELFERIQKLDSWQGEDAAHFSCEFQLKTGSVIGLYLDRSAEGTVTVVLVPQQHVQPFALNQMRGDIQRELAQAGFQLGGIEIRMNGRVL